MNHCGAACYCRYLGCLMTSYPPKGRRGNSRRSCQCPEWSCGRSCPLVSFSQKSPTLEKDLLQSWVAQFQWGLHSHHWLEFLTPNLLGRRESLCSRLINIGSCRKLRRTRLSVLLLVFLGVHLGYYWLETVLTRVSGSSFPMACWGTPTGGMEASGSSPCTSLQVSALAAVEIGCNRM